jgi:hypothetical protein
MVLADSNGSCGIGFINCVESNIIHPVYRSRLLLASDNHSTGLTENQTAMN